ncbi:MAG: hypothetical protein U0U46_12080 [Saprospiraceae bacterium]
MIKSFRRKRAIKLLNEQLDKIDTLTFINYDNWKSYTDAIISQFIDEKFVRQSQIMGFTFDLNFEDDEDNDLTPEEIAEEWIMMKKHLGDDYVSRYINYLESGGDMTITPNWFCKRTVSEILSMIAIFQAILLGSVLPFTCNQGKIQGAADSKKQIEKLEQTQDSLRTELINCISNLPKPNDSPKDKTTKNKD